jgi:cob(I)alamin adenosyltransferase
MRSGNPPGSLKVLPVMVKINRVYTRTGDDGRTVLGDGGRLPKFHIRIAATGSVDEANAFIGWAARHVGEPTRVILKRVQNDLFDIGADLCRPDRSRSNRCVYKKSKSRGLRNASMITMYCSRR